MLCGIPSNVYFRFYGDNVFLFNCRNWATALIRDVGAFKAFFTRHQVDVETTIHQIAAKYELLDAKVWMDFHEVFDPLIADRYFVTGDRVELVGADEYKNVVTKNVHTSTTPADLSLSVSLGATDNDGHYEEALVELTEYFASHPTPFELCIDLTQACTERCVHCYVPEHGARYLQKENVFRVLNEFVRNE